MTTDLVVLEVVGSNLLGRPFYFFLFNSLPYITLAIYEHGNLFFYGRQWEVFACRSPKSQTGSWRRSIEVWEANLQPGGGSRLKNIRFPSKWKFTWKICQTYDLRGRLDFRRSLGSGLRSSFPETAAGNRAYLRGRLPAPSQWPMGRAWRRKRSVIFSSSTVTHLAM